MYLFDPCSTVFILKGQGKGYLDSNTPSDYNISEPIIWLKY